MSAVRSLQVLSMLTKDKAVQYLIDSENKAAAADDNKTEGGEPANGGGQV